MGKKAQITALQIIQAALRVAAASGAGKVTLDAVAKAAGVSKGGLIYHFPSKDALIAAMVQHLLDDAECHRQQLSADEPSLLAALLQTRASFSRKIAGNTAMAILAAAAEQPALLKPVQQHNQALLQQIMAQSSQQQTIAASAAPSSALLLFLASEALLFHDLLHISPFTEQEREQLEQQLVQQAREL